MQASRAEGSAQAVEKDVAPIGQLSFIRLGLGSLVVYLGLAVALTTRAWASPATFWIGGCCDPEQSMWFLQWVPYALTHGGDLFVTYQQNAPVGVNLMWQTPVLLISLVLSPITVVFGPVVAYNVAITLSITLSAWCAWLALRRYASGILAPIVGGAAYGFSPYVISHASMHLDLVAAWGPPLFLLLIDEIVAKRRRPPVVLGLVLGLVSIVQLLTAEEVLATSAIAAGVLIVVLAVVTLAQRGRSVLWLPARRLAIALSVATVTFVALAAVPLAVQFLGPLRVQGSVGAGEAFSTDLLNLVLPTQFQLISPQAATQVSDHFSGLFHEAGGYLGFPLLLFLMAFVARHWDDLRVRVASMTGGILYVLSFGQHLRIAGTTTGWPLPWLPLSELPLLGNVIPARIAVFALLAVAVLLTIAVDRAVNMKVRKAAPRLVGIGFALLVAMPAPLSASTAPVPAFFANWADEGMRADAVVMIAPFFWDGAGADPMLWAAIAGDEVRMPEAYGVVPSADGRPHYGAAGTQLSNAMEAIQDQGVELVARGAVRAQIALDLRDKSITDVIVGPMRNRSQMVSFFTDLFGRPPEQVDGVQIWRGLDRSGVTLEP